MKIDLFSKMLSIVFVFIVILLFFLFRLGGGCISSEISSKLYHEAALFEQENKLQDAYRRYSIVFEEGCNSPEWKKAANGATRLAGIIGKAYDDTVVALDEYRKVNGKYPDSLEVVRENIPKDSLAAFDGFGYHRESDEKMAVVTGMYGSVTFSLKK